MIELATEGVRRAGSATCRLYVVGGTQRHARTLGENDIHWYRFGSALMLEVDTRSQEIQQSITYVSPPEACAPIDPAILFKGAVIDGESFYVCTPTEVLVYKLPGFELQRYLTLPVFNDLHHARPGPNGSLLVASTGLDAVVEVDPQDRVTNVWSVVDECGGPERLNDSTDYRRIASTKPHLAHPNQIFLLDDEPWVTRFEQRDAISLRDPGRRIEIGLERVHDGLVVGDAIYFTTVDGHIAIASKQSLKVEEVLDLNAVPYPEGDRHLGWCRGVYVDGDCIWVGFSRLRLSRVRANLSWVRWGFKPFAPTRIACYDVRDRSLLREINLQDHGLDAVFSILPAV